jgi:hypothetical protein
MKVKIGPYNNYFGPYQIAEMIFFWVKRNRVYADEPAIYNRWDYKACDSLGDWLCDTWVDDFCHWIDSKRTRKVKIRIDKYDTWSMDDTLGIIIHPMLVQLKATNHGYFVSDPEDAPTIGKGEIIDHGHNDDLAEKRYEWIMDEMIWAFGEYTNDDANEPDYKTADSETLIAYRVRKTNAFRLFGKYYQNLWD